MQLKRQMVFESVDVGRIHEQTLDLELYLFAGGYVGGGVDDSQKTSGYGIFYKAGRLKLCEEISQNVALLG